MSYKVYLTIDTGGVEPHVVVEVGSFAENVNPMYEKAFQAAGMPKNDKWASVLEAPLEINENTLQYLDGLTAGEAIPCLERAIGHMIDPTNVPAYKQMNPTNGWGSYDTALQKLRYFLSCCRLHPKTTLVVY